MKHTMCTHLNKTTGNNWLDPTKTTKKENVSLFIVITIDILKDTIMFTTFTKAASLCIILLYHAVQCAYIMLCSKVAF